MRLFVSFKTLGTSELLSPSQSQFSVSSRRRAIGVLVYARFISFHLLYLIFSNAGDRER